MTPDLVGDVHLGLMRTNPQGIGFFHRCTRVNLASDSNIGGDASVPCNHIWLLLHRQLTFFRSDKVWFSTTLSSWRQVFSCKNIPGVHSLAVCGDHFPLWTLPGLWYLTLAMRQTFLRTYTWARSVDIIYIFFRSVQRK